MDNSDEDTNGSFEFVDKAEASEEVNIVNEDGSTTEPDKTIEDEWDDVLGSGELLKKVIKKGNDIRPDRRDICKIKFECRYNGTVIEKVDEVDVSVSDSELVQGLDLIIPLMYIGEVADVKMGPRFAYGEKGLQDEHFNIPPNAALEYTIELISFVPEPEFHTLSVDERLKIGIKKKDRGNWWFKREEYSFAVTCYKRAIEYLDYNDNENQDNEVAITDADGLINERINVYNNLSAAQLRMHHATEAITSCDTVLTLQPNNVKALFRKSQALTARGERKEALKYVKKVLEIDPANSLAQNDLHKLQNMLWTEAETEKKLYKKMFRPQKSTEADQTIIRNTWIKLGVFVGSLVIAVVGVVIYRYNFYSS